MKIKISSAIDKGKVRENNEDDLIFASDLTQDKWSTDTMTSYLPMADWGTLTVVADGMGGAQAGEVAAALAIQAVKQTFVPEAIRDAIDSEEHIKSLLRQAVINADDAIINHATNNPDTMGMGTTIVICWFLHDKAYIIWCGDSRCYVYHPHNGLTLLTKDHSLVQEMVDNGQISEKEAFNHPDSNIITRVLGDLDRDIEPDIVIYDISPGDTFVLCTDGLCGYCHNDSIERCITDNYTDSPRATEALFKLAMDAGGYDNICIIVASFIGDNQEEPKGITLGQKLMKLIGL